MSNEEFSQHAPALLELLTDKLKRDKDQGGDEAGEVNICGAKGTCQVSDIIPDGETIENDKTTCASNKIQKERRVQHENEGIDFPDHFSLESDAISSGQLRDPGVPGVKWFNTFLKKDRFLPETGKPLLPSYLRKLGVVFAVISNSAKNLSEAMTIASQVLHHSPDNHASLAQNYTIVNYRLRGQPYDQGEAIKIFDENSS
ncbi:hypothetical protein C1645_820671 [Glomus cerebriforme]|uniref:Uncharacterized protein n=1 Tax=Glomus cerebriforme TaxID=658196 RepID=A0A397T227_9GLOM|nr:hypothetical protein C1645_820671 [Glomus cerebriforme]